MFDELYKYFGGSDYYTKEEWDEQVTNELFDIVEVDDETEETKILEHNVSYGRAKNALFGYNLKDYDFEIQMRFVNSGKLLAKKTYSPAAAGGRICVCKREDA